MTAGQLLKQVGWLRLLLLLLLLLLQKWLLLQLLE